MNFFTPIIGLENAGAPHLWHITENYLSCGNNAVKAQSFEGKRIRVISAKNDQPLMLKVLKIASYATIFLPLIALIVRSFYRSKYSFEIITTNPKIPVTALVGTATQNLQRKTSSPEVNNAAVIEKIQAAKTEGRKIALFLGRADTQSLPSEKNWLWVSLDETMINPPKEDHPHLQMNFNEKKEMQQVEHLFDKVVVDWSVLKFMHPPWLITRNLLVPSKDSEAIIEAYTSCTYYDKNLKEPEYHPAEGYAILPESVWGTPPIWDPAARKAAALEELYVQTEKHLTTLFDEVHLHYDTKYPYRDPEEEQKIDFWVLKSPKGT